MKNLKKLGSIALALVMVMAMMVPAFAAGNNTITVTNAEKGATYTLYKIFDAEVIANRPSNDAGGITYKLTSGTTMPTQLANVFQLDATNGTIKAVETATDAQIMTAVKTYAQATPSARVGDPVTNTAGGAVVFDGLDDGYYAVLSNVSGGAAVTITSIAPNARVIEKNSTNIDPDPKNSTKTLVDQNGTVQNDKSVFVGEKIYYMVQTTAANWVDKDGNTENGAEHKLTSYTVKDEGATFLDGLKIESINVVDADGNKTAVTGFTDGATTYEIPGVDADGNHLYASGVKIQVIYSATVNANIIGTSDARNNGWITPNGYTDPTDPDKPHEDVYTYDFNLNKFTMNGETKTNLTGAEFTLSKNSDGSNPISFVAVDGGYRVAVSATETGATTTLSAGNINIDGLDAGTYYLKETKAPSGYNLKPDATTVVIVSVKDANNKDTAQNNVKDSETATAVLDGKLVEIENSTGAVLPSTGGMGTTIFYAIGGILLAGSAVLFVTKKRMGE